MKKGSKVVGAVAIIYRSLAILGSVIFIYAVTTALSEEFIVGRGRIVVAGSIV